MNWFEETVGRVFYAGVPFVRLGGWGHFVDPYLIFVYVKEV